VKRGAIILCGGKSTRMGRDKASLPFGEESMLARVLRIVGQVVPPENIVIVAAAGQALPPLREPVAIVRDKLPERGPLEGLAAGLAALTGQADACYATACDVPLLVPDFLHTMFDELGDYDIAVPKDREFFHPLAAVYRTSVLPNVRELLARDQRRASLLFEVARTKEINADALRTVDPELHSLKNLNHPEDYAAALRAAGVVT
jgi:molybdopterin-guanine dinucleotide biosynthesis protein A